MIIWGLFISFGMIGGGFVGVFLGLRTPFKDREYSLVSKGAERMLLVSEQIHKRCGQAPLTELFSLPLFFIGVLQGFLQNGYAED